MERAFPASPTVVSKAPTRPGTTAARRTGCMPCRWSSRAAATCGNRPARSLRLTGRARGIRDSPPRCAPCWSESSRRASGLEADAEADRDELGRLLGLDALVARLDEPGLTGRQREVHTQARIPREARRVLARDRVGHEARAAAKGIAHESVLRALDAAVPRSHPAADVEARPGADRCFQYPVQKRGDRLAITVVDLRLIDGLTEGDELIAGAEAAVVEIRTQHERLPRNRSQRESGADAPAAVEKVGGASLRDAGAAIDEPLRERRRAATQQCQGRDYANVRLHALHLAVLRLNWD